MGISVLSYNVLNQIFGWTYFVAWSISFYPQVFMNYYRQSVIGLNLDFVFLNFYGFTLYSIYNIGIYVLNLKSGSNPIQINDIVFSTHALLLTTITAFQVMIYPRGNQRISRFCWMMTFFFNMAVCFIYIAHGLFPLSFTWSDVFKYLAYIKIVITFTKYLPQIIMNFWRKSTVGFAIWGIILDTTGGVFSIAQMTLDTCVSVDNPITPTPGSTTISSFTTMAHAFSAMTANSSDLILPSIFNISSSEKLLVHQLDLGTGSFLTNSIIPVSFGECMHRMVTTNLTKLLLGLLSLGFDLVFYIQHYCLYKPRNVRLDEDRLINPAGGNGELSYDDDGNVGGDRRSGGNSSVDVEGIADASPDKDTRPSTPFAVDQKEKSHLPTLGTKLPSKQAMDILKSVKKSLIGLIERNGGESEPLITVVSNPAQENCSSSKLVNPKTIGPKSYGSADKNRVDVIVNALATEMISTANEPTLGTATEESSKQCVENLANSHVSEILPIFVPSNKSNMISNIHLNYKLPKLAQNTTLHVDEILG